ncbi:MAG TPA: glycosyltransferase [Bacteroidia bacterium]|nr:glycosyltransferase [Bacteroidia bacterium]
MTLQQFTTLSPGMIAFWVLAFAVLVQLFYHFYFFLRVATYRKKEKPAGELPPVSVVICARNEDDNLVSYLPLVLAQDYSDFEVVVVNDCSYDNTGDILEEFAKKNAKLKVVTIKEDEYYQHGKKVAVMMGIKGAKHEHLVLTDADCRPATDQWLKSMAGHFHGGKEIVIGYGPYERGKGFLSKLIRFDSFFIGLQYLSYALARVTYMGVGRNLAYTKKLFYSVKGFASHYHIRSGDDDLFVNEAATRSNVSVELGKETFCYSPAKKKFRDWWYQKKRHLETGKRYRFSHRFLLGLYVMSQWLFFAAFITALVLRFNIYAVCGAFLIRFCVQMLIFNSSMKKMEERDLLVLAPLFELFFLLFYPVITVSRIFQRKNRWN